MNKRQLWGSVQLALDGRVWVRQLGAFSARLRKTEALA